MNTSELTSAISTHLELITATAFVQTNTVGFRKTMYFCTLSAAEKIQGIAKLAGVGVGFASFEILRIPAKFSTSKTAR